QEMGQSFQSSLFDRSFVLMINPKSIVGENSTMRKILIESILSGGVWSAMGENVMVSQGIIPPTVFVLDKNYRESVGAYVYPKAYINKAEAKDEFFGELTALELEKLPKTTLITSSGEPCFSFAGAMQQIWSHDLSTYINIEQPTETELYGKIAKNNYDLAITPIKTAQNDVWEFLNCFSDCVITIDGETGLTGDFLSNVKDLNTAEIMAEAYKKIEFALIDSNFVLPLYYAPTHFVVSTRVKDIEYIPEKRSIYFGNAQFV
ncbi:MAG: hypothetical protein RR315_05080, partial [Oscillospiraceae bacterium]